MPKITKFLFAVLVLLASVKTQAQVTFSDQTNISGLFLSECGLSDTMTVRLTATSAQTNITVNASVPSQFVFVNWIPQAGISISGTTVTVASIPATTSVDLKFLLRAKCGANSAATSYKVNYTIGNFSGGIVPSATPQGSDYISGTKAPVLSISNVGPLPGNNNNTASLGSSYTRRYKFFNTGSQSQIDTLQFIEILQQGLGFVSLKVDGVTVTPTVTNGGGRDTIKYTIIKKMGNLSTNPGDTVIVEEVYQVNSCPPGGSSSSVNGYWGCLSSPICQQAGTNPSTQVPTSVPNITFSTHRVAYGCFGATDTMEIRINNTGGAASGLNMQVATTYINESYLLNPSFGAESILNRLDTTNFWVSTSPSGPWTRVYGGNTTGINGANGADTFIGNSMPYFPHGSLWRRNVVIGNVAASSTLYFRALQITRCPQADYCGAIYKGFPYRANWKNNCGNTNYNQSMLYTAWDYVAPATATADVNPPDLYDGDTALLTFTNSSPYINIQKDSSKYYLEITYPTGYTFVNDTSFRTLRTLVNASVLWADSVVLNSTNRTVRYWFRSTGASAFGFGTYYLKAKFKMACSGGPPSPSPFTLRGYAILTAARQCPNYSCTALLVCPSTINVVPHCGICFRGGLQPRKLLTERTTLGLPDNNEDGKPDPSGTLDYNNIEINKVAPRDTFRTVYRGKVLTGAPWAPSTWAYAGAQTTFPMGNNSFFGVKGLYADVTVFDASAGTSYNLTNIPLTTTNSGNQRVLTLDFSPSSVSGYPGGFTFANNDSVVVNTYFLFNEQNNGTSSGARTDLIQTKYWVSPLPNGSITNDSMRYRCDDLSTILKQVVAYYTISSPPQLLSACGSTRINWNHYLSIGNCCDNYNGSIHFPKEYRNFGIEDSFQVTIPAGFTVDSANIFFHHTSRVGNSYQQIASSLVPARISGNVYTYDIKSLYTINGGKILPSKGGFINQIGIYLKPSCSAPTGVSLSVPVKAGFTGIAAWTGQDNSNLGTSHVNDNQVSITYRGPSLDLGNYGPTNALASQKVITWDLVVRNNSTVSAQPNTWVGFRSASGNVFVDSVEEISASNVVLTGTNITNSGGIYQLGTIAVGGGAKYFRVYAHYTTCKRDSLRVYSSWNCSPPGYPANLAGRPCLGDSTNVYLDTVPNSVQTDWFTTPSNPTTMCNPITYEVDLSERVDARAYRPYFDVILPAGGAGAAVSSAQFKYPANTGTYVNITGVPLPGGIIRYYVGDSNTTLKNNGLAPYEVAENNNRVRLKFTLTTNCAWVSGSAVRVRGTAFRPCGDLLPPDVEFHPVNISGAPVAKIGLFIESIPGLLTCGSTTTYRIWIRNLDPSATVNTDSVSVALPSGGTYVAGSTVYQKNAWAQTNPTIRTVNGNATLTWGAGGTPAFDTTKWTFQVASNQGNVLCSNQDSAILQYTSAFNATCGLITCSSKVLNTQKTAIATIKKPNLDYVSPTGTFTYTKDTNALNLTIPDTVRVNGAQFTNTGNDTARGATVTFWYDANNNGVINSGEAIIATQTLPYIAPGTTYTWSQILVATGHNVAPCNSNIRMRVNVNCNCDSANQVVAIPVICREVNTPLASLGNFVWIDDDLDGIQDAGELGVAGVTVTLFNASGVAIASTVTDAFGAYSFTRLPPSSYTVQFTPPANYDFTTQTTGTATGSDANPSTGRTPAITLTGGQTNNDIDCGLVPAQTSLGSIGDYVWYDTDKDGIQDSGEPPLAGVTVTLYNAAGAVIGSTITDNQGKYTFNDLPAGTYSVGFTPPIGMVGSPQTTGTATGSDMSPTTFRTPSLTLTAGQNRTDIDAGFYPQDANKAAIGNKVWNDLNNNGIQDAGEPGVEGVTVTLYNSGGTPIVTTSTDAFGNYVFNDLAAGTYSVGFGGFPSGFALVTANVGGTPGDSTDSDPNTGTGRTGNYTLAAGERNMSVDAGLFKTGNNFTLGDKVFVDSDKNGIQNTGEPGLAGVMVILRNSSGTPIDTTYTDQNGKYLFTNLAAGTYSVQVKNLPDGYSITSKDQGGNDATDSDADPNGITATVTLNGGNPNDMSLDIGLVVGNASTRTASLGDKVWYDLDNDGIQDVTEPGAPGVKVYLYAANGTTKLDSTVTDAQGNYIFTALSAGDYVVGIVMPPTWSISPLSGSPDPNLDNNGNAVSGGISKSSPVSLISGQENLSIDFGLYKAGVLVVGDHVFLDANQNGIDDGVSSEPGLAGIGVTLIDGTGNVLGNTVTDANGNYLFVDVPAGNNYRIRFTNLPSGYSTSGQNVGANDGIDNDASPVSGYTDPFNVTGSYTYTTNLAATQRSYDAGVYPNTVAALAGTYWIDADNDGIQDANEAGIPGMRVTVYNNSGVAVATTITDANGNYLFPNLAPGTYTVGFEGPPSGYQFTTQNASGSTSANNSDVNPSTGRTTAVTLNAGDFITDVDGGINTLLPASLGNFIWFDTDEDGVQDVGEPGVPGVVLQLLDNSGNVVATAVTDGEGGYLFSNLLPGTYSVRMAGIPPGLMITRKDAGGNDNTDNDFDKNTLKTAPVTLTAGQNITTLDGGLIPQGLSTIGSFVFLDLKVNGIADGDPPISGVKIYLFDNATNTIIDSTVSNAGGGYLFDSLPRGNYRVRFISPPGLRPTYMDIRNNTRDSWDSDIDTITGFTNTIVIPTRNFASMYNFAGFTNLVPLSLDWLSFNAINQTSQVMLQWKVASEENTAFYEVQRRLTGQKEFINIGKVTATGYSSIPLEYIHYDKQNEVFKDVIYYRINALNTVGKNDYSITRTVYFSNTSSSPNHFTFWPNPANTYINVSISGEEGFNWEIIDISGKAVFKGFCSENNTKIDVSNMQVGVYLLRVKDAQTGQTEKLIINR